MSGRASLTVDCVCIEHLRLQRTKLGYQHIGKFFDSASRGVCIVFAEDFFRLFVKSSYQAINDDPDGARCVHPERSCSNEVGLCLANFALSQIANVEERRH